MKSNHHVPIGNYRFDQETIENFQEIFKTGRLTYGPFLRKFESEFARLHEQTYGVFCVSGTSALHVALKTHRKFKNWAVGDEVLVPALTFVASSNVVLHEQMKPVFVEIESDFFDMDPERIEEKITPRTRAIMPVHLFGMPCRMQEISDIAQKHGLTILEDCCQCTYGKIDNKPVGSWSELPCFSTYCGSLVFTGVGGLVLTNDQSQMIHLRKLLAHGRDEKYLSIDDDNLDNPEKLKDVVNKRFCFVDLGFSFRMTEFEGAVGLPQIKRIDEIFKIRRNNAEYLIAGLEGIDLLQLPRDRDNALRSFRMFPIKINGTGKIRNTISFYLEQKGIETRPLVPLLDQPYYIELFGNLADSYPIAKDVGQTGFYIGCHEYLDQSDLDYTIDTIKEIVRKL